MPEGRAARDAFLMRLRGKGFSKSEIENLGIETLYTRLAELEHGKSTYLLDFDFRSLTSRISTAVQLKKRLEAEISFYENLYRADPAGRFKVSFKRKHKWPDGSISNDLIAFECPRGKEICYTKFDRRPKSIVMPFFQGKKGVDFGVANRTLGHQWFEAFMGRIIQSYAPMQKAGIHLFQYIGPENENSVLTKQIRDRYFTRTSKGGLSCLRALNLKRKRVNHRNRIHTIAH